MPPEALFDLCKVDFNSVVADIDEIRKFNPQRFEMEMLTAIVYVDPEQHVAVGYKDVRHDEFWVRGHMPEYPIMPGVLICEAAAQMCNWYARIYVLPDGDEFFAFGGMDGIRFRGPVRPGDRLVLVGHAQNPSRRVVRTQTQGFVNDTMVFEGTVFGMPFKRK